LAAISGLQAALVVIQAALAGRFLTGARPALLDHREIGLVVVSWTALAGLAIAILWWKLAAGPAWPILAAILWFLAVGAQIGVGFAHLLVFHIPLGVLIFGLNLWMVSRLTGNQWRTS
jgi:hypothetical protein